MSAPNGRAVLYRTVEAGGLSQPVWLSEYLGTTIGNLQRSDVRIEDQAQFLVVQTR
ncbi:MAG: hypothetical protein AB1Z98_18030 [Nannocystaceae bacterium]